MASNCFKLLTLFASFVGSLAGSCYLYQANTAIVNRPALQTFQNFNGKQQCVDTCTAMNAAGFPRCQSVVFDETSRTCFVFDSWANSNGAIAQPSEGSEYFEFRKECPIDSDQDLQQVRTREADNQNLAVLDGRAGGARRVRQYGGGGGGGQYSGGWQQPQSQYSGGNNFGGGNYNQQRPVQPINSGYGNAGPSVTTQGPCNHKIVPKKQFIGFVYKTDSAPSLDDCIKKCIADQPKCKSGHWFSDTKECYLKSNSAGNRAELLLDPAKGDDSITYFEPCLSGAAAPATPAPSSG